MWICGTLSVSPLYKETVRRVTFSYSYTAAYILPSSVWENFTHTYTKTRGENMEVKNELLPDVTSHKNTFYSVCV